MKTFITKQGNSGLEWLRIKNFISIWDFKTNFSSTHLFLPLKLQIQFKNPKLSASFSPFYPPTNFQELFPNLFTLNNAVLQPKRYHMHGKPLSNLFPWNRSDNKKKQLSTIPEIKNFFAVKNIIFLFILVQGFFVSSWTVVCFHLEICRSGILKATQN